MLTHVHQNIGSFLNAAKMKRHVKKTYFHVGLKSQTGTSSFHLSCECTQTGMSSFRLSCERTQTGMSSFHLSCERTQTGMSSFRLSCERTLSNKT